jgi:hypothetical protein
VSQGWRLQQTVVLYSCSHIRNDMEMLWHCLFKSDLRAVSEGCRLRQKWKMSWRCLFKSDLRAVSQRCRLRQTWKMSWHCPFKSDLRGVSQGCGLRQTWKMSWHCLFKCAVMIFSVWTWRQAMWKGEEGGLAIYPSLNSPQSKSRTNILYTPLLSPSCKGEGGGGYFHVWANWRRNTF